MLTTKVDLPTFHADQVKLLERRHDDRELEDPRWARNAGGMCRAVRIGRRGGKTTFLETWLGDGALKGYPVGYFAPTYKYVSETYERLHELMEPVLKRRGGHNKTDGMLRLRTGGSIEFWTLEDPRAGRSRKYRRVALDEAAFTKNKVTLETWRQSIKPTLGDLRGAAIAASNTNGVDPDNLLYALCNDPAWGFIEHHAPSWVNPHVPERLPGQTFADWLIEQTAYYDKLREGEHPLVFAQEYAAEFVDFSGVSLFDPQKLLVNYDPLRRHAVYWPQPLKCDAVFAIVDTSSKAEKGSDGTAVGYFALQSVKKPKLLLLDWELIQVEGSLLEHWLPSVVQRGQDLATECGSRAGFLGGWIEDKDSGIVLLQQARRRSLPFKPIPSDFTAIGKDGRALSISGYVYRGEVGLATGADKVSLFKGTSRNHLFSQVTGFKLADPKAGSRADDLFDIFAYGVSAGLGDGKGW